MKQLGGAAGLAFCCLAGSPGRGLRQQGDFQLFAMTRDPWEPAEDAKERAARREAYERLARAARRAGMSLERLNQMLRQVTRNELETRQFLARDVYGVPDELLDDLLRVRIADLEKDDPR